MHKIQKKKLLVVQRLCIFLSQAYDFLFPYHMIWGWSYCSDFWKVVSKSSVKTRWPDMQTPLTNYQFECSTFKIPNTTSSTFSSSHLHCSFNRRVQPFLQSFKTIPKNPNDTSWFGDTLHSLEQLVDQNCCDRSHDSAWSCRNFSDGTDIIMQNFNRCTRHTFLVRSLRNITGTYECC